MVHTAFALRTVQQEVDALLRRMAQVRPFALAETMVPAATPARGTMQLIDRYLVKGRRRWAARTRAFARWLRSPQAFSVGDAELYRQYVLLRLEANAALAQLDLFSDAITQRSETSTGVFLAGLDHLAQDALALDHSWLRAPPVLCYLDTGIGAAIRRARTRLPGGGENPVALIRMPRERMVGLGIGASLVHEAGHQGAALLDLVPLLRRAMEPMIQAEARNPSGPVVWRHWGRWISEIVADLWAVSRLGVSATLGVMNVISLPRVFVFRANEDDPHPTPWVRVLLSAQLGQALYPSPHWAQLITMWGSVYPLAPDALQRAPAIPELRDHAPVFARWLLAQRLPLAEGQALGRVLGRRGLSWDALSELSLRCEREPQTWRQLRPCDAFAVLGHQRMQHKDRSGSESELLSSLLTHWALNGEAQRAQTPIFSLSSSTLGVSP